MIVDFDHKDPVVPIRKPKPFNFIDAMTGAAGSKDIICLGQDHELGFDFVPPTDKLSGQKTRVFRKNNLQKFLADIGQGYDMVFVRGLPEYHFIENTCLMEVADDCILCVDASRTHFADLRRTVMHMDSDKLRGLIVIGS